MSFADRPPSSAWEQIPFADEPHTWFWAWFKPQVAPHGVVVRIPEETHRNPARRFPVTVRRVLAAMAIAPPWVAAWSLYGLTYDAQQGANPALDFPIPEPAPGVDPSISIFLHVVPAPLVAPMAAPAMAPAVASGGLTGDAFVRIDAEWSLCQALEVQLAAAAKQLNATLLRINSLNRDLSSDEGRAADQLDKKEWQEARRWLRDVAARVSRFLKDHHIGMTSNAGKRKSFETIHEQYIVPKRQFDGIVQSERDFEQYHKTLQTLLNNMNAAQTSATTDGERRAQAVLTRIGAKVRSARSKR